MNTLANVIAVIIILVIVCGALTLPVYLYLWLFRRHRHGPWTPWEQVEMDVPKGKDGEFVTRLVEVRHCIPCGKGQVHYLMKTAPTKVTTSYVGKHRSSA